MSNYNPADACPREMPARVGILSRIVVALNNGPVRRWVEYNAGRFEFFGALWIRVRWTKAKLLSYFSDLDHAKRSFASRGERFDVDAPLTFNEKLWFLKLSNRDQLLVECSDKHEVRRYVERCGLEHILKKEYANYSSVDELDFDSLPSPTYIKCSHGSGLNWVYRKSASRREQKMRKRAFKYQLRQNPYLLSREWNYKRISPSLVCEEVLETASKEPIPELQFFCFHGIARFVMYNMGLADETGAHQRATRWSFSPDYELLDVRTSMPTSSEAPTKPLNYDDMLKYAEILAAPFPHVRVDLFNVDGVIYFNELTFYSGGGFVKLEPSEWQEVLGGWLSLEGYSIAPDSLEGGFRKMTSVFTRREFR